MIHWCGTGLSAVPGLRRLIQAGHEVTVWNRSEGKARAAVGNLTDRIETYTPEALAAQLKAGDIVVSMLPADHHVPLAMLCITHRAHFVSSSYISPEMRALEGEARRAEVALVNEVGLDPGIDHLMAYWLVEEYRASAACKGDHDHANALSFLSYCGGVPKEANAFRYKFSWSPLGVLKALRSPSRSVRHFTELQVARPWEALGSYDAPLVPPETFEVYPNRDSLPFIQQYHFDPAWKVKDFVRGTLRLNGWAEAWAGIFETVEAAKGPEGEAQLAELANRLWQENSYGEGEPDRVVLCVSLKAEHDGSPVWHKTWVMDAWGDVRGSAMARLVSGTVALAVESLLAREIKPGVHAAPDDPRLVRRWMDAVEHMAQRCFLVDHLTGKTTA